MRNGLDISAAVDGKADRTVDNSFTAIDTSGTDTPLLM